MNMSWYGMEEHQTIVIDNGSTSIRAGFAPTRDGLPDTIFPAVVGRPKNPDLFVGMGQKSVYVGDEIGSAARSNLTIRYPIERGIITNWDDMEKIWHHVFNNELRVTPSNHPVLLTEVGLNPKAHREKMTQIMFETFEVPGLYITPSASIALYAYGRTNGVVLTSGGGVTQAIPVYSLHPIQHGITQLDIGGNDITQHLIKLIKDSHNIDFSTGIEVREMDYIKTKCTFVAEEYEFLLKNLPPEANYDVFDGHITLKEDRFKAPEILFNPSLFGLEASGVHELIFNAVMKSDESIRKELFQAVALAGGNTVIPGFTERLTKELRSIVPKEFNTHVIPPSDPKNAPFLGAYANYIVLQSTQTRGRYRGGEVVFEWDFEIYDLPATSDCYKSQQDLIDDEYLAKFPVKYFFDQSDYTHVMDVKDIKHKKYDPSIDYKRLALKVELKYHQYELWRDSKALDEAFHNEECSCLKEETELVLYDGNNEEITELESKYDISVKEDGYWKMTAVLGSKEFEDAWDERSNSDCDSDTNGEQPDADMTDEAEVQSKNEGELMDSSRGAGMKDEADRQSENEGKLLYSTNPEDNLASVNDALVDSANSENSEDNDDEPQYDGLISLEQRDMILEDIALSERCLKLFIHVLSAIVLGHCPAPSCHDSVHISTAKFEHSVVRTGDIVDEVIAQLKYATTLQQSSSIISTMICALQKLRVMDLLFLKQGTEQMYPYLSAICSVYEVEDNISLVFYMADIDWGFEFDHSVNPWTSYFQADLATDDDLDAMPDWLSIRHSIHRLMRKGGVSCATPNATEFALHKLSEFIHKTLSSVVSKNPTANALEVTGEDIVETVETLDPNYRATMFTNNHNLFCVNPIILNSDSEDYSDESSVDSDWIAEPITDLDDDTTLSDREVTSDNETDEAMNEDPLHSILQESLEKCVQHAQFDAKEYNSEDEREDSTDERLWTYLDEYWDSVTGSAPGHDDKTAYYMPKNLVEDAITYSGQTLTEDDALAQLFIHKYEEDIPFHDMPDEQRNKMIELRSTFKTTFGVSINNLIVKTNQMLKEQCEEEFNQSLNTKYRRMKDNVINYDSSLRSDANECKTMIVDLSNSATLKRTVQDASSILRSNSVLKSVKLMNLFCTRDEHSSLFSQLINDIANHPSITSVVLSNCRLMSYLPLSSLVKKKQLTKFHLSFPLNSGGEEIEGQNEFLQALQNSESIKDLMLPFGGEVFASTMTVMLPRLDTLHIQRNIAGASNEAGAKSIAELLQHPHQLKKVVVHLSRGGFHPTDDKPKLVELLTSLNISHEVVYY